MTLCTIGRNPGDRPEPSHPHAPLNDAGKFVDEVAQTVLSPKSTAEPPARFWPLAIVLEGVKGFHQCLQSLELDFRKACYLQGGAFRPSQLHQMGLVVIVFTI